MDERPAVFPLWPALRAHDAALASGLLAAIAPAPHSLPPGAAACALALRRVELDRLAPPASWFPPGVAGAAPGRMASYLAGRLCAERALAESGAPPGVARDVDGAPVWPPGYIGSITHDASLACAAVLPAHAALGLGIDTEGWLEADAMEAVAQVCMTPAERRRWLCVPAARQACTAIFSAKEAFYKAAFPLLRRWIDFEEVEATALDLGAGTLAFQAAVDGDLAALLRSAVTRLVVTGTAVHASVVIHRPPGRPATR